MSSPDPNNENSLPELTREPLPISERSTNTNEHSQPSSNHGSRNKEEDLSDRILRDMQKGDTLSALHPYQSTLTTNQLESCVVLENLCFSPDLAATKAKFNYRITQCGHLCFGLFTSVYPGDPRASLPTFHTAPTVQFASDRRQVLLAHLVATLTTNFTIQEEDMSLAGHKYYGRTIAVHSLAVLPEVQGLHLGKTLMKSFIHMMKSTELYDRISLITYENLTCWYELLGFVYHGPSACKFGGKEWHDMVYDLKVNHANGEDD